jgi:NAD-dependent DNA ligase
VKAHEPTNVIPLWHYDPPTNRQIKVLRFFGLNVSGSLTKGSCSSLITRLFSDPTKKHLWTAYVLVTGDEGDSSSELMTHDIAALAKVPIPEAQRSKRGPRTPPRMRKTYERIICEVLKEGSPFDDPLPKEISIAENIFCFTGEFQFGTRKECQAAITSRGGTFTTDVNRKTKVLVIGHSANPNWSHGTYGNKILKAMFLRLQFSQPCIIPEHFWLTLLSDPN